MSPATRTTVLIIVAVAVIAGVMVVASMEGRKLGSALSLPKEYRGSAISSAAPASIPADLVPNENDSQTLYYSNPQSSGSSYETTQSIAALAAFYKQGFSSLGWTLVSDQESAGQAFLSAHRSDGSAATVTMVQFPGGVVRVNFAMQQ